MLMFRVEWLETSLSCCRSSFKSVLLCSFFHASQIFAYFTLIIWFQSFVAGVAASGALTSGLRLITKAAFEDSNDGLRKGASKFKYPYFFP